MSVVGETFIAVRADTGGFADDLKAKITSAIKNPAVIAGAAVATVSAGVAGLVKTSTDKFRALGSEVTTFSRLTGQSAEDASRLVFAAQRTGVGADALAGGIKKLSVNLASNNKALGEANIQYRDAKGNLLPLNSTLGNIAAKFKTMPNGIEKNRLAIQRFGKSGTDLIPILNKGRDGLAELSAQSDKYGLTLSQKNLDAIKKYKVAQGDLSSAFTGLQVTIGSKVLPVMADFAVAVNDKAIPFITSLTGLVKENLGPAMDTLAAGVKTAYDALIAGFANPDATIGPGVSTLSALFLSIGSGAKARFPEQRPHQSGLGSPLARRRRGGPRAASRSGQARCGAGQPGEPWPGPRGVSRGHRHSRRPETRRNPVRRGRRCPPLDRSGSLDD